MQSVNDRILLAKVESVYGTDPTPTVASNAIAAGGIKVTYPPDVLQRNVHRANKSPLSPLQGKKHIEVGFSCEIKGSGSVGVAPALGALFKACGFSETVSAGSSVTYNPGSGALSSVTLYVYDQDFNSGSAILHKVTGAVCSKATLKLASGNIPTLDFTFVGLYNDPSDVALPSAPTYESTVPPIVDGATFSLNSVTSLVAQEIGINFDPAVAIRGSVSAANSIAGFAITGRSFSGSFNPEAVMAATYNFYADWKAATQRALSVVVGATAGNICTITAPKVTINDVGEDTRDGILAKNLPFTLGQNAGNDELVIKFT